MSTDLTKATPRPWRAVYQATVRAQLRHGRPEYGAVIGDITGDADAALIVKAVNLHDKLIAALRELSNAWFAADSPHWSRDISNAAVAARAILAKVDTPMTAGDLNLRRAIACTARINWHYVIDSAIETACVALAVFALLYCWMTP